MEPSQSAGYFESMSAGSLATFAGVVMALPFLGLWLYQDYVGSFLGEVREESAGGAAGFSSVFIRKLGAALRRFMSANYESNMRRKLTKGGDPQGYKPEDILALQVVAAVFGLVFGLLMTSALGASIAWSLLVLALGAGYPLIWVNDQVKKRHHLITRALPYSLDLLTLSVEAGLDFTAALNKVVEKGKAGPLRDEFNMLLKQLKMGKTREEALKAMVVRVDLPALTSFITALIQADKMGTSLGKVLRIQSTQLRIDRTQRAEKLAGEAPVKMLFPLIACIFPTVFMVLFGPIVFALMFGEVGS